MEKATFTAPNGKRMEFFYRRDTNDYQVILAIFVEDSLRILDLDWSPEDVMVNIGAHIGAASLLALTNPGIQVYAYEAVKESVDLLRRNAELNGLQERLHAFRRAVWKRAGSKAKVYLNTLPGHRPIGTMLDQGDGTFELVRTTSLSEILRVNQIERCKLLKMDVEGAEYAILKAASLRTLAKIERIHGQWHRIGMIEGGESPRDELLSLTKGVFRDETPAERADESGGTGMFIFVNKRLDLQRGGSE